jgi:putative serine protease PepD
MPTDTLGRPDGPFCVRCGQRVGPAGCPTCAGATEPNRGGVRAEDVTAPRRAGWRTVASLALVLALLVAGLSVSILTGRHNERRVKALQAAQSRSAGQIAKLRESVDSLGTQLSRTGQDVATLTDKESHNIDTAAVAARIRNSVFTVEMRGDIGTAFAFAKDAAGGTLLVTNFHVVADDFDAGIDTAVIHRGSESYTGMVVSVNRDKDLAAIHIDLTVPVLKRAAQRPRVGDPIVVAGAPLGLGGTVTNGVVSAFRDGLLQFSAPISPGNSGGPVVDGSGHVVGVAEQKVVGDGAEGLGFAIPVAAVCSSVLSC